MKIAPRIPSFGIGEVAGRDSQPIKPVKKALAKALTTDHFAPGITGPRRDAAVHARELLRGDKMNAAENGTIVKRDPRDVNVAADQLIGEKLHAAALKQVKENLPLERQTLARMPKLQQAQYETLREVCVRTNDSVARLSLQKLLFEGSFPGGKDLKGGQSTLARLSELATSAPLEKGVDRNQLVTDVLQELATPSSINQGERGTCAPTTIAIQLASAHPAEYVRLVEGLASKKGTVELADGTTLAREAATAAPDGTSRSVSQRLMGSAFMEVANEEREFQNTDELRQNKDYVGDGATAEGLDRLYSAVMGRKMGSKVVESDDDRTQITGMIDSQLRNGVSVSVGLTWGGGGHQVLVTGKTSTGDYRITNPWGREEQISATELRKRLIDVNYDPKTQKSALARSVEEIFRRLPLSPAQQQMQNDVTKQVRVANLK